MCFTIRSHLWPNQKKENRSIWKQHMASIHLFDRPLFIRKEAYNKRMLQVSFLSKKDVSKNVLQACTGLVYTSFYTKWGVHKSIFEAPFHMKMQECFAGSFLHKKRCSQECFRGLLSYEKRRIQECFAGLIFLWKESRDRAFYRPLFMRKESVSGVFYRPLLIWRRHVTYECWLGAAQV